MDSKTAKKNYPCCANCKHLVSTPKGNRYDDYENFCLITGYYTHSIYKDRTKNTGYSPTGKKLECKYERKDENEGRRQKNYD